MWGYSGDIRLGQAVGRQPRLQPQEIRRQVQRRAQGKK